MTGTMTIRIDEELRAYIDPLTPDEYAALEQSLLAEGCRDALVLWGDLLVDGHNRHAICSKHGIAFNTVQNTRLQSMDDVRLWMIDNHLGRRSVSDFQRGVLALRKKEILESRRQAGEGDAAPAGGDGPAPLTRQTLAAQQESYKLTRQSYDLGVATELDLSQAVAWAGRSLRESASFNPGRTCGRIASLGYAVPGTVLAIGLLAPFAWLDHTMSTLFGWNGLLLIGTTGALVCAYTIRFLAISTGGIEAGLARIPASLEQASRLLGETSAGTLRRVHLPLLRPALAASALLVFVDTMKELPATLLLRPLNFETLATWLYAEAARGTYEEGAVAALAIVAAGLIPVILLARTNLKMGH